MDTISLLAVSLTDAAIFVPVIIAIITSFAAPAYLARRKNSSDLNISMIKEQTEYRRDLQERIDKLEHRLEGAGKALNAALDAMRELKSQNEKYKADIERCEIEIATLRKELEAANKRIRQRLHDLDGLNGNGEQ